jgi:hypothetical protein
VGITNVPDAAPESNEVILKRIEEMFYAVKNFDCILETKRVVKKRKVDGKEVESDEPPKVVDSFIVKRAKEASDVEVELACWKVYVSVAASISY